MSDVLMNAVMHADWPAPSGVHAVTTLRHGAGVSLPPFDSFNMGLRCGDDADAVMANRQRLVEMLSLPSEPCWLRQVHGVEVVRFDTPAPFPAKTEGEAENGAAFAPSPTIVGEGWGGVGSAHVLPSQSQAISMLASSRTGFDATPSQPPPAFAGGGAQIEADASVTSMRGTVLAIITADCLPVVFAAQDGGEVAAAHAGWRGLAAGILEATVAAMHASPANVIAWLGPAAGLHAYEIGEDVLTAFATRDPRSETAFAATRPGHWRVDLYALARMRLADVGVTRVFGGGLCTISDPQQFFSHRRDQRTGRMATVIHMT